MKPARNKYYSLFSYKNPVFICVEGHPVRIKGYPEFEFFYYLDVLREEYRIVEATCGLAVGPSSDVLTETKEAAKDILDRAGKKKLAKHIRESIEKNGLSPRYRGAS